jgi:tetratricopeptide (TPR) repeat protein
VRAADFMAEHGVRGRGFNDLGGAYLAWRFWPERERLPFITGTLETVTPEDRRLYTMAQKHSVAWRELDARHRFEYVVLSRYHAGMGQLLDFLDADTTSWALVFADDAAAVYLRRDGPHARLAADSAYRLVPGGTGRLNALGAAVTRDPAIRARTIEELERQVASSRWSAHALGLLANVALVERRYDEARALLGRALAIDPALGRGHERLGLIALEQGRPRGALAEFERERALNPHLERLALRMGQAYQALGDTRRARDWYRRELAADPGNAEARDSLAALERGGTP